MAVITEDGIEEDGSSGLIHLAPIEYQIAKEERRKDEDRELDWKQRFFQTVYQKFRSHRPLPQLLNDHDECENTLERGVEKII